MNNLHIITVATHSEYYFPYLVESCKKNGKELKVLGFGEKWKGFTWRFKLMLNYINNLNDDNIVCFLDGYDVLCTRNLEELIYEFNKLKNEKKCKIIIGHDKRIYNKYSIFQQLNNLYCKYYFNETTIPLNAGNYIGYVKDLKYVLNKIYLEKPVDSDDDQKLLTKYYKNNKNDIYVDIDNKLFLVLGLPFYEPINYINVNNNNIIYNNIINLFLFTVLVVHIWIIY
jgi:hypothetical protein